MLNIAKSNQTNTYTSNK